MKPKTLEKKLFVSIALIVIGSIVLNITGCKTQKTQTSVKSDSIHIQETLKPVALNPDSAIVRALFECDSNRNVVLKQFEDYKTKGLNTNYSFSDGLLSWMVNTGRDTIYVPVKEIYVQNKDYKTITITKHITETKFVNVLNWWEKICYSTGLVSMVLFLVFVAYKIYKFIKK